MEISDTLKAISDHVRRDILEMLKKEKKTAGEIAEKFSLAGATVSYHLAYLKKANLVRETKYKNYVIYELNKEAFEETSKWLKKMSK